MAQDTFKLLLTVESHGREKYQTSELISDRVGLSTNTQKLF